LFFLPQEIKIVKEIMAQSCNKNSRILEKAERIYRAALAEVNPKNLIAQSLSLKGDRLFIQDKCYDLAFFKDIFLVAIGKAASSMAKSVTALLQKRITEGICICPPALRFSLEKVTCLPAPHPLPDERSVEAAKAILALASKAGEKDLVLVLISGGGSSQICLPGQGVSLQEKRLLTEKLLRAGANIQELNIVRKHLSRIKGGRLAQAAFPATVVNLVISDVIHNDLESIASGPTYWDSSTYSDALLVLKKYGIWNHAPSSIKKAIKNGLQKKIEETPKRGDPVFARTSNFILGDNLLALKAAQREAQRLGFKSFILTSCDQGEARCVARYYVSLFRNLAQSKKNISKPFCLLAGGELTVTVKGKGEGGRNQEFVLAALKEMRKQFKSDDVWLIASLGSDGIDGSTDAAGAWIAPITIEKMERLPLDLEVHLKNNDSYNFFKKVGGLIKTGPTSTNVMDLRIFLLGRAL
jgi:glycerate-2-kinase